MPVYYLAQAYSRDPSRAFTQAVRWTYLLRRMGKVVFSPVLHTHNYDQRINADIENFEDFTEEYQAYQKIEDYVVWDLAICQQFLNQDWDDCGKWADIRNKIEADCDLIDFDDENPYGCCGECEIRENKQFDSGFIMLFAPTCFSHCQRNNDNCLEMGCNHQCESFWASKGAFQEWKWAKDHHVKCLLLEPLLAGREEIL